MNKNIVKVLLLFIFLISPFKYVYAEEIPNEDIPINNETDVEKYEYYNEKTKYLSIIEDDANLLNEEEKVKLLDSMTRLTEYGHIIFKSIDNNDFGNAASYASNYYHNKFQSESGTLFLIDMDTREIYIFSDGENYKIITSKKA